MVPPKVRSAKHELLADRQLRRWELQHRMASSDAPRPAPCVAISRLPGAGGEEIGRLVAKWLDYGFFDREFVEEIARDLHVDPWIVQGLDERVRSAIDRFLGDAMGLSRPTESDVMQRIARIVATLGRRGNSVIVGRGAAFLLSTDEALRVLVTAPRAQRIERYAEVKRLDPAQAEAALARAEEERNVFARRQFGVSQEDPLLYDLVLNTGTLSFEAAAALVVEALRRRFPS